MDNFQEYIKNVKEQLNCNATKEFKEEYITYLYSNEEIDNNLDYFEKCMKKGLSAYKSLLFFGDYNKGESI
jgi:hypothetical protein